MQSIFLTEAKEMRNKLKRWIAPIALLVFAASSAPAAPVGLELLLLVDVSSSVSGSEYDLQKNGYINAFRSAAIQAAIASITGGIAVAYAEWSGAGQQSLLVDWALLTDATSADGFADDVEATVRAFSGVTAPGSAINWGVPLFTNDFEGTRLVIDVSGDGVQNNGANTFAAATAAFAAGIRVNGLPIGGGGLDAWYLANIVTPGGGFQVPAADFADFQGAVQAKIGREIIGIPEPSTYAFMGAGLAALALFRRRRAA